MKRLLSCAALLLGICPAAARADIDARKMVPLLFGPTALSHSLAVDGRIPLLARMPPGVDARARGLLPVAPGLGAIQLRPDEVARFSADHPDLRLMTAPPRKPLLDYVAYWSNQRRFRQQTGLDGSGVVVGIVDTGLDVAHPDFRDQAGKTRVAWLMTRAEALGKHADLEQRFGCTDPQQSPCAIYSAADLDAAIAAGTAPGDSNGHGTHVSSIAAGNGGVSVNKTPVYIGMAPNATLVVASPSSEGFSDPDILNAVRFIFDRADALGLPAVVNLSLGSDFGPHDGTGLLERGLAAMVGDDKPGRVIVVAAGNSGGLYQTSDGGPFGAHTETLVTDDDVTRVPLALPGQTGTVNGAGFVWITFDPGDAVKVGLDGPDRAGIGLVAPGDDQGYHDDSVQAGVVNDEPGGSYSIADDSAVVSWSGSWSADSPIAVRLRGHGHAQLWVSGTGDAASGLGLLFEQAIESGTVAVPASEPSLIAVGCVVNRNHWPWIGGRDPMQIGEDGLQADSACGFSGAGPTPGGGMKPDLLAPGQNVVGAMSSEADPRTHPGSLFDGPCPQGTEDCLVVDDFHAVTSGTSMSAPAVTGDVALLLQKDRTLTQRRAMQLLQGSVSRPIGAAPFEPQVGPGQVDMLGALQIVSGAALPSEASAVKSWLSFGAAFLRPAGAPASGAVLLRDENGNIVGDVPDGALSVAVAGATLSQPIDRVAPGLWRFSVSADPGTGGQVATIDARYRDKSLGRRTVPIAADPWQIGGSVNPVGGCAVSECEPAPNGWIALALVSAFVARRGRKKR